MASPLKLKVDVDMASLVRAAKDSSDAVDDLSQSFDDVGTSSTRGADKAGDSLRNVSQDAESAASGVDKVGGASDAVAGQLSGLGDAAQQALGGDVAGGV